MGINHGIEWRAGGRKSEREGGGGQLADCPRLPPFPPSLVLLSFICAYVDEL